MNLSDELEIIMIDAIINYIRDTFEITPELIDKLNNNRWSYEGDNPTYFREYNIHNFIAEQFNHYPMYNNLKFGNYVLENNIFNKDNSNYERYIKEIYEDSANYRAIYRRDDADEKELELYWNNLAYIISFTGKTYLEHKNTDFILDFLNSYYDTPILK